MFPAIEESCLSYKTVLNTELGAAKSSRNASLIHLCGIYMIRENTHSKKKKREMIPLIRNPYKVLVSQSCPAPCDPMDCMYPHQAAMSLELSR